jgi:hypothetical protein
MDNLTAQGVSALKAGDKHKARELLRQAIQQDQKNVHAWLALSLAAETTKEQIACLKQVLTLDPNNKIARSQLARLQPEMPAESKIPEQPPLASVAPAPAVTTAPETPTPVIATDSTPSRNLHTLFLSAVQRLFDAPYLPASLILLVLLIILTDASFTLMGQPADYWFDHSRAAVSQVWLQTVLEVSPFLFAGVTLLYVIVVGFFLFILTRGPALILWTVLSFVHLNSAIDWSKCNLTRIFSLEIGSLCSSFGLFLAIFSSAIVGLVLARTLLVSERPAAQPANRRRPLSWFSVGVSALWLLFLLFGLIASTSFPDTGWQPIIASTTPPGRIDGEIAYDNRRGRAVLFGGATDWLGNDWFYQNDTWEWDGNQWLQLSPELSPPARVAHTMVYDESRGVVVLFGGRGANGPLRDTWEWDGSQWQLRNELSNPSARCCHQMIYDSQRGKVVIFGGYDGQALFHKDGWEWSGEQWLPIIFESSSPVASGYSLTYDQTNNQAVAFLSGFPNGTWLWSGVRWARPTLEVEPPERNSAAMVFDPLQGQTLLFGGVHDLAFFGDTWLFNGQTWQEAESPRLPAARWGHALFYDPQRQRIILFGGFDGESYLDDMWQFTFPES